MAAKPPPSQRQRLSDQAELREFLGRLRTLGFLIGLLLVIGTAGFALFEHRSVWFAFVWSLDTVATVGSIKPPTTVGGDVTKVVLIIFGVGTLFFALVTLTEFFVAGHVAELLAERRDLKMIASLTDHHIICGFGRVGRQIARDLRAAGHKYVVIDRDAANRQFASDVGVRFIEGDPGEDEILRQAGIEHARTILACVDSDADNIFIALSARELRPDIEIVARASVEDSERKLLRAGADRVISPYKASGHEMARYALHPHVAGVVDVSPDYRLEAIEVNAGSTGAGQTIGELRGGAIIVAVKRPGGAFLPSPAETLELQVGDVVVAMGTVRTMDRLESLFDAPRVPSA